MEVFDESKWSEENNCYVINYIQSAEVNNEDLINCYAYLKEHNIVINVQFYHSPVHYACSLQLRNIKSYFSNSLYYKEPVIYINIYIYNQYIKFLLFMTVDFWRFVFKHLQSSNKVML